MKNTRFLLFILFLIVGVGIYAQQKKKMSGRTITPALQTEKADQISPGPSEPEDTNRVFYGYEAEYKPSPDYDMKQYLAANTQFPATTKTNHVKGWAMVEFIVAKDGTLSDFKIKVQSVDSGLDAEALRLMTNAPKWRPARYYGRVIKCRASQIIDFK